MTRARDSASLRYREQEANRAPRRHVVPESGESRRNRLPVVSMADVAAHDAQWIVIDDQVLDVTDFSAHHPGGCATMYAHLGLDASADFHHVSAHHKKSVDRKVAQLVVARVGPHDDAEGASEWLRLRDYLCVLRNSFVVQRDDTRDPLTELVFSGQSYCHLLDDHIPSVMLALGDICADVRNTCPAVDGADSIGRLRSVIEGILAAGDVAAARAVLEHLRDSVAKLMGPLVHIAANATRPRVCPAGGEPAPHAAQAMDHIGQWIEEEHAYWHHS